MSEGATDEDRAAILLVDDRPENLLAFEALLGQLGHRLVSVRSGEAAVEAALKEEFALVLLDFRMPGMDGIETAAALKSRELSRGTPIIFVTADGTLPGNMSAYVAGAVDILVKPFDIDALRAKVSVFAELWQLRRREARRVREESDRRAEEGHRASLEALFRQAPVGLAIWEGTEHVITFVNHLYAQMFPGRELVGRTLQAAFPEFNAATRALWDGVFASGEPYVSYEFRIDYDRAGKGTPSEAYFTLQLSAARRSSGKIHGVIGVATDVTDLVIARREASKAAQREVELLQKVRASEARFRRIHESGVIGVAFWNRDGRLVDANDAFLGMVGYSREDLSSGRVRWRDMTPPEFASLDEQAFVEMEAQGFCRPYEKEYIHRDGHRIPILLGAAFWEGSTTEGVAWVLDNGLKKKEERRRDLLAKASRVLSGSLELEKTLRGVAGLFVPELADWANVYLLRDDGSLELAACVHIDPSSESAVRATHARMPDPVRALTSERQPTAPGQFELLEQIDEDLVRQLSGGDQEWLALSLSLDAKSRLSVPMVVSGRTIGAIALVSRRSERRFSAEDAPLVEEIARRAATAIDNARLFELAREERRRADDANRLKDEFLAVVSHELRTPLNAMLGWANMLSRGTLPAEQTRKAIETIERNAKAQARLIEDLLDISRVITGKLRLDVEQFDIVRVIETAIEVVKPAAEARGVKVQPLLDRGLGEVVADPNRIQQAVWNLLSNAVKFTSKGGRVTVGLGRSDGFCTVTVQDTGAGIAPAFLPFVFDRFRQAEMSTSRQHGGLGLGLAIVRHIAELHGGTVEAHSEGVGRGATFILRVPVAPPKNSSKPPPSIAAVLHAPEIPIVDSGIAGLSILVVDDEPDARELLASMLEHFKAKTLTASTAEEGFRRLVEARPDVLISDIGMPGEDGYSFIARVRALPDDKGGRTPAIALTAFARTADRTKALLAGFDMHLPKPVDPSELLAVIESVSRPARPRG